MYIEQHEYPFLSLNLYKQKATEAGQPEGLPDPQLLPGRFAESVHAVFADTVVIKPCLVPAEPGEKKLRLLSGKAKPGNEKDEPAIGLRESEDRLHQPALFLLHAQMIVQPDRRDQVESA